MAPSSSNASDEEPVHEIQSLEDLQTLNCLLATPSFLRGLFPSQLPSRAASTSSTSTTPTQADFPLSTSNYPPDLEEPNVSNIQHQLQGFVVTHYDADVRYDSQDSQATPEAVNRASIRAWIESINYSMDRSYLPFEHGHSDVVLAVDFHMYGARMVTASSDHKLKVWDKKDDNWTLTDSWKAHDAEIVDVSVFCKFSIISLTTSSFKSSQTRSILPNHVSKNSDYYLGEMERSISRRIHRQHLGRRPLQTLARRSA
jgi:WD40 repeat protein